MSCCEGRGCGQCNSPERREINRVANLLIAEWQRVEKKQVNVSYVATFADMARVVIDDTAKQLAASQQEVERLRVQVDELEANAVRMREYRFALEGVLTDGNPLCSSWFYGKDGQLRKCTAAHDHDGGHIAKEGGVEP